MLRIVNENKDERKLPPYGACGKVGEGLTVCL
jgi:hypothetical protein